MQQPDRRLANVKWFSRRQKRRSTRAHTAPQIATLRLNDLAKLYRARYGQVLPDDDAGREDLATGLSHIATLSTARERMRDYLNLWAPWMTGGEGAAMIDYALTHPQRWTADQLAWRMRLTSADRTALGITTIGAIDLNKAARTKRRKAKDRKRLMAKRRAAGAKPRAAYLASIRRGSSAP